MPGSGHRRFRLFERHRPTDNYGNDCIRDFGEDLNHIDMRLTNRANGAVMDVVLVGRFVQNANGEYVISGWNGTAGCP